MLTSPLCLSWSHESTQSYGVNHQDILHKSSIIYIK
jgi:hypothetical protein